MARISGVDLPNNKRSEIGLIAIYGIGRATAKKILDLAEIDPTKKIGELSSDELGRIRKILEKDFIVEGDLRTRTAMNIKRLQDIGSFRGIRHRKGLPVNGQRTRTNARTRKGPRKTVANKKKETK